MARWQGGKVAKSYWEACLLAALSATGDGISHIDVSKTGRLIATPTLGLGAPALVEACSAGRGRFCHWKMTGKGVLFSLAFAADFRDKGQGLKFLNINDLRRHYAFMGRPFQRPD